MAGKLSICCPHVTEIITDSGSIRKIPIGSRTPMTVARASQSMAEKRGLPKITSRLRSFTTLPWIMPSLITFMARNRTIRASVSRAGQIGGRLDPQIGSWSEAESAALLYLIRGIGTSFIQTTKPPSPATTKIKKKYRMLVFGLWIILGTVRPILFIVFSG